MARIFAVPQRRHSRSCWKISSGERNNEWSQNNGTCPGRTVRATNKWYHSFSHTTGSHAKPINVAWPLLSKPQITRIIAQKELINGWQETEARYKNNQNYSTTLNPNTTRKTHDRQVGGAGQAMADGKKKQQLYSRTHTPSCVCEKRFPLRSSLSQRKPHLSGLVGKTIKT